jgi:hypothetical protein
LDRAEAASALAAYALVDLLDRDVALAGVVQHLTVLRQLLRDEAAA